jgi:hypothetical protein
MSIGIENPDDVGRRLIPLVMFNNYYPDPSPAGLRWLIFKNVDDFRRCVVKRGRRVLIDEQEYFRWLREHNERKNGH